MIAIFYLVLQILKLYSYVVIANVIISWLIAFNVLNTQNRFVYSILEFTYKFTDPIYNRIRRFLPNLHTHRFWVDSEKRYVKLRVSSKGMRIIDKKGIDQVLSDIRANGEAI